MKSTQGMEQYDRDQLLKFNVSKLKGLFARVQKQDREEIQQQQSSGPVRKGKRRREKEKETERKRNELK